MLGNDFSRLEPDAERKHKTGLLAAPVLSARSFVGKDIPSTLRSGYGANLPEFRRAVASGEHFNPWPDEHGLTRRVPMRAEHQGAYYNSFSLAMNRLGLGSPAVVPGFSTCGDAEQQ